MAGYTTELQRTETLLRMDVSSGGASNRFIIYVVQEAAVVKDMTACPTARGRSRSGPQGPLQSGASPRGIIKYNGNHPGH